MNSAIDLADPSLPGQWCHAASGGSGSLTFRSLILQQPSELNCKKGCWQIPVSIISVSLKKIGANRSEEVPLAPWRSVYADNGVKLSDIISIPLLT